MTLRKTFSLVLLSFALLLSAFGSLVSTPMAVAQDRRSERDDDDDDRDSDRRSESYRRWRERSRDRSDRDRSDSSSQRESNDSESTDRGSGDDQSMAMTDYAKSLVKQHDKNGNMMLEGDEVKQLRGRAALADANNDNVVTVDELVARLSGASTTSTSTTSTTSNASSSGDDKESDDRESDRDRSGFFGFGRDRDRDSDDDRSGDDSTTGTIKRVYTGTVGVGKGSDDAKSTRRTYRFTPAGDRLPTDLPSWFKSRDRNSDGQVQMSEYTRSWSSRMVAEFRRYDLNDDGVITPKEAGKK
jgi:hypothetical protein